MKRSIAILAITVAASAHAGVVYNVQSNSSGMRSMTIAGKVSVEGQQMRVDLANGDNLLFKDNSVLLSNDGGKTMAVFDPASKNYYELHLEDMIGSAMSMLRNLPGGVKFSFENPQVNVTDAGDGGAIEGFPTHKYVLDASYDIVIDAMGQTMSSHMSLNTESWTTDQLSAEFSTFLQARGMRTGIEALDKLIEAQSTTMKGLALKQVSTVHVTQGTAGDMSMVTTSLITNVERKSIDRTQFAIPAGYTKVDDPITKMLHQLKQ